MTQRATAVLLPRYVSNASFTGLYLLSVLLNAGPLEAPLVLGYTKGLAALPGVPTQCRSLQHGDSLSSVLEFSGQVKLPLHR